MAKERGFGWLPLLGTLALLISLTWKGWISTEVAAVGLVVAVVLLATGQVILVGILVGTAGLYFFLIEFARHDPEQVGLLVGSVIALLVALLVMFQLLKLVFGKGK